MAINYLIIFSLRKGGKEKDLSYPEILEDRTYHSICITSQK